MDKSMIPILVALVAIVAAGAAMAFHGGGTEESGEPPSGYPPLYGVDSLYFEDANIDMEIGQKMTLTVTISPATEDTFRTIEWIKEGEGCSILKAVNNTCVVEAVAAGHCTMTAMTGNKEASCHVTVKEAFSTPVDPDEPAGPDVPVDSILDRASMLLIAGDTGVIKSKMEAVWSVSDESVCEITPDGEYCVVVAIKAGVCTVTATSGEVSESCWVTVIGFGLPADIPGASLPGSSIPGASPMAEADLRLAPGGSRTIDVPSEYLPLISWSSSDPSVCTVTVDLGAGTATAVAHKAGECDLTASLGFYSAVCHVTVG